MNCCKHKKLFAYQLIKQLNTGLIIDDETMRDNPNLNIWCDKCDKWNIIKNG